MVTYEIRAIPMRKPGKKIPRNAIGCYWRYVALVVVVVLWRPALSAL